MASVTQPSSPRLVAQGPLRFVTATSIFDGHDAAINIIRRLLQGQGAEVVHLGHNRGVEDIVRAALQEDVDGIAVSSYQGGHLEFFRYLLDSLKAAGAGEIRVFAGGGGTITDEEANTLEAYGVEKIYRPEDGQRLGLEGMAKDIIARARALKSAYAAPRRFGRENIRAVGRRLSLIETGLPCIPARRKRKDRSVPVVGVTGSGGSGKSTVIDELLGECLRSFPTRTFAVIALDPTRQKSGGALLGDRLRMNFAADPRVFMRSMATRRRHLATNEVLGDCVDFLKSLDFDLIIIETAGAGQGGTEIVGLADVSLYVMTADYGGPTQLEKIQMLDYADLIALNKCDARESQDALRDVRKQWRRNRNAFTLPDTEVPVYATVASRVRDPGVAHLFYALCEQLDRIRSRDREPWTPPMEQLAATRGMEPLIPPRRSRYLGEIAEQGRAETAAIEQQVRAASQAHGYYLGLRALGDPQLPAPLKPYLGDLAHSGGDDALVRLRRCYQQALATLSPEALAVLDEWPQMRAQAQQERYAYRVRGAEITGDNATESLSHLRIPRLALPQYQDWGSLLRFLLKENLPGRYPYTAGVYPYRRGTEEPTRMFAGEGGPERTNRRFHYLAAGQKATRLSTAFDPIVLYGEDPDTRPDIYGRLGMSGVSVATLDDVKKLYSGFGLCDPATSVSMTINGPAPILLACFMNAAIDQQVEKYLRESGRWQEVEPRIAALYQDLPRPQYRGPLPQGHDGLGLGLLGVSGGQWLDPETYARIRADTLARVRGTVQADILKEDQAQNECIFAIELALRMMGDIQEFFIAHRVRNYYSVSVSGYHIAEAGANPVSQLAFTLANGFTLVEYYLGRGMAIDQFAPSLSFFFSNGMDPEYAVLGRVARRIWARALREIYRAGPRSQMLKYHVQTSGRSLHAREIEFNDIRTSLQALYAIYDNCNSLHTNAYDEAVTTPTEESARRALAIQLIINRELGLNYNENPLQGSFIIEELTDRVEEAVYEEFTRLSQRGGVLGAMETLYQRMKIQEESLYYESRKQSGDLALIGVNTFVREDAEPHAAAGRLVRASEEEKRAQIEAVAGFKRQHADKAPQALRRLQAVVDAGGNTFAELMDTVRDCSLGQITQALYEVGGRYRRRM